MGYVDTVNYKFKKPEETNNFDVNDLNNALDLTDTTLKKIEDKVDNLPDATTGNKGLMTAAQVLSLNGKLDKAGGTITNYLGDKNTAQVRNITTSTSGPSGGRDGDIWIRYRN